MSKSILLLATGLLFVVQACTDSGDPVSAIPDEPVYINLFQDQIQPILNNYCSGCHIGDSQGGLSLSPDDSYANLVGIVSSMSPPAVLVVPGDTLQSVLWQKLTNTQQAGGEMPPGSSLPQTELQTISSWILMGAPEFIEE